MESHLERGLKSLQEQGKLAEDADIARLAQTAMACVQGGLLMAHLRHDITPIADALKLALDHLKSHARP